MIELIMCVLFSTQSERISWLIAEIFEQFVMKDMRSSRRSIPMMKWYSGTLRNNPFELAVHLRILAITYCFLLCRLHHFYTLHTPPIPHNYYYTLPTPRNCYSTTPTPQHLLHNTYSTQLLPHNTYSTTPTPHNFWQVFYRTTV